jgi:hypothetical protein
VKKKKGEKDETAERKEEQRNYYTTEESRIFVDPFTTRHSDASSSACGTDKNERKSKNRKQEKECIVLKALRLER